MARNHDRERKAAKNMTIAVNVFGVLFLIVWCILAASMGAWFMLFFGIPFLGLTVYRLIVCLRLAKEDQEPPKEQDPWDVPPPQHKQEGNFCPYCGYPLRQEFAFCPKCGRKLSQ